MIKIIIHDVETNEVTEREMTSEELIKYEADKAADAIWLEEAKIKEETRQAVLNRLGLTAEEAKLLLS